MTIRLLIVIITVAFGDRLADGVGSKGVFAEGP